MTTRFSNLIQSVLFCTILALNPTALAAKDSAPAILVLGDSLSGAYGINTDEGWVALLQKQITKQGFAYRVINASVSGDTTRTGLGRLDAALKQHQPAIVIVALGGNDGLRGLPFTEIESSLATIIERCQQRNTKVLLAGVRLPPNYGPAYNQGFAKVYARLARRYAIPLVPRLLDDVAEHRDWMQPDGIHPTARAQPRIMQNVWTVLKPLLQTP